MDLKDAISRARDKSNRGRERRKHNYYNSPAYSNKLIQLFSTKFREYGYGEPPPTTKKVKGMLNGFIKVCRSSGWAERRIYASIALLVEHWDYIKKCEHHTLNNKKAALGDRPSLLEFVICRETMLTAIDKAIHQKVEVNVMERKIVQVTKAKRFAPSEEEMQDEYNRLMENL